MNVYLMLQNNNILTHFVEPVSFLSLEGEQEQGGPAPSMKDYFVIWPSCKDFLMANCASKDSSSSLGSAQL